MIIAWPILETSLMRRAPTSCLGWPASTSPWRKERHPKRLSLHDTPSWGGGWNISSRCPRPHGVGSVSPQSLWGSKCAWLQLRWHRSEKFRWSPLVGRDGFPWYPFLGPQRSKHHTGVCFSGVHHISIPYRTDDQAKNAEKQTSHWCLLLARVYTRQYR